MNNYKPSQTSVLPEVYENLHIHAKNFIYFRFKQERELNIFKTPLDIKIKDIKREIYEETLSVQRLEKARVRFEKSDNFNESLELEDKINFITEELFREFQEHTTCGYGYKMLYSEKEEYVRKYFKTTLEIKDKLNKFKENQRAELKQKRKEIQDTGYPMTYLNYLYRRVKTELGLLKQYADPKDTYLNNDEYVLFNEVFNNLKDELILKGI